jgi:hypothetical protein
MEGKSGYMTKLQTHGIPVKPFFLLPDDILAFEDFVAKTNRWQGVVSKIGFSCLKRGVLIYKVPVQTWDRRTFTDWMDTIFSQFRSAINSNFPLIVQQFDNGLDPDNPDNMEYRLYFVNATFIVALATSWASSAHTSAHIPCQLEIDVGLAAIHAIAIESTFIQSYSLVRVDLGKYEDGTYFVNEMQVSSPSVVHLFGPTSKIPCILAQAVAANYISLAVKAYYDDLQPVGGNS